MAQAYLSITDGASTLVFHDGAAGSSWYKAQDDWVPQVAQERQDFLAGHGPYENVGESIPIAVGGSNAAHMYANLYALKTVLARTNRVWYGSSEAGGASLARIQYSPANSVISSSGSPFRAAMWDADVILSQGFNVSASGAWMLDARLVFTRTGEWLHNQDSASQSGSNGRIVNVILSGSTNFYSPCDITISNSRFLSNNFPGIVILTDGASKLAIIQATDLQNVAGSPWASVADTTRLAIGGSVLRYTPTGTTEVSTNNPAASTGGNLGTSIAIFASMKNNGSQAYAVRMFLQGYSSGLVQQYNYGYTPYINVDSNSSAKSASPNYQFLGVIGFNQTYSEYLISMSASASATGGTLDVDQIVLVNVSDPGTNILTLYGDSLFTAINSAASMAHRREFARRPRITVGTNAHLGYQGMPLFYTQGASLAAALLKTGADTTPDRWVSASSGSLTDVNTWTIARQTAYLIPR